MNYSIKFPDDLMESVSNKRKDRLNYEFNKNMKAAERFGESKHDLKIRNHKVANETNAPYKQPRGMFGIGAAETYEKQGGIAICAILRKHPDLKHLSDFVPFVAEYVGNMINSGLSPATICTRVHALVTALGVEDYHAFGLTKLPKKSAAKYTRCRVLSTSDEKLTGVIPEMLRRFTDATGLRSCELKRVKTGDLFIDSEGVYRIRVRRGKGGKYREALVYPYEIAYVISCFENPRGKTKDGQQYLFKKKDFLKNLTLQTHRVKYAENLYMLFKEPGSFTSGTDYKCRKNRKGDVFDRGITAAVSHELGHNRLNVAVDSYLYNLHFDEKGCR